MTRDYYLESPEEESADFVVLLLVLDLPESPDLPDSLDSDLLFLLSEEPFELERDELPAFL